VKKSKIIVEALNSLAEKDFSDLVLKTSLRELAVIFLFLENDEAAIIKNRLPDEKRALLAEEIVFHRKLHVSYAQFSLIADRFLERIGGNKNFKCQSWLKPVKK